MATGIDPTEASGVRDGLLTRQMLSEVSQLGLRRDDENTNRVVSILRKFEQQLYKFQSETEGKIFAYLEAIERNVLTNLDGLETQVLLPMLEVMMRGAIDSNMARKQSEHIRHLGEGATKEEIRGAHTTYDEQRDRKLVEEMRQLIQKYRRTKVSLARKPALTVQQFFAKPEAPDPATNAPGDYY